METNNIVKYIAIASVITAIGLFAYVVNASNMISYLSEDPKVCINCHVMNTQYSSWQHSSHREKATCVQCHLPQDSFIDKMIAKSRDGFNHSMAMTFKTYESSIRVSDDAAKRIQANCIYCHKETVSQMVDNSRLYQKNGGSSQVDRSCRDCHRTPHDSIRSLLSAPNAIGVKELFKTSK